MRVIPEGKEAGAFAAFLQLVHGFAAPGGLP